MVLSLLSDNNKNIASVDDDVAASCDLLFCMCLSAPKKRKNSNKIEANKQKLNQII